MTTKKSKAKDTDIKASIQRIVKKGKVLFGSKETIESLLIGNPKYIILSNSCPREKRDRIIYYSRLAKVPYKILDINSKELGILCGKPFPVASMAILDSAGVSLGEDG
ncbi:MAG TPA: 50S ribosomal protein L30e [Candidatus Altiarchaeales archaeon]|nr:50S ribosomal protein L30e [Candidatus Altiarchaeales archaeon]